MKQIEDARAVVAIALVERLNRRARVGECWLIVGQGLLGRVMKIGQQGKEQVRIAITEIADLQGLDKIIDFLPPAEQGGNNHHGAVIHRDAAGKIQPG